MRSARPTTRRPFASARRRRRRSLPGASLRRSLSPLYPAGERVRVEEGRVRCRRPHLARSALCRAGLRGPGRASRLPAKPSCRRRSLAAILSTSSRSRTRRRASRRRRDGDDERASERARAGLDTCVDATLTLSLSLSRRRDVKLLLLGTGESGKVRPHLSLPVPAQPAHAHLLPLPAVDHPEADAATPPRRVHRRGAGRVPGDRLRQPGSSSLSPASHAPVPAPED